MTTTSDNSFSIALPANHVHGPKQGHWTYEEYAALPDDGKRYEIMNGVLIVTPAPEPAHQSIAGLLTHYLIVAVQLKGLGRVYPSPIDVRLTSNKVVQPDVAVLLNANLHKIGDKNVIGGPDLVVEIASPSTALYDRVSKSEAYEQAGVSEYWVVRTQEKAVEVLVLEDDGYQSLGVFSGKDTLPSRVAPGIADVAVEQFFVQG
jgi:Uma2 family endonuclease